VVFNQYGADFAIASLPEMVDILILRFGDFPQQIQQNPDPFVRLVRISFMTRETGYLETSTGFILASVHRTISGQETYSA
jgi:hypothetical protein